MKIKIKELHFICEKGDIVNDKVVNPKFGIATLNLRYKYSLSDSEIENYINLYLKLYSKHIRLKKCISKKQYKSIYKSILKKGLYKDYILLNISSLNI